MDRQRHGDFTLRFNWFLKAELICLVFMDRSQGEQILKNERKMKQTKNKYDKNLPGYSNKKESKESSNSRFSIMC